MAINLSDNLIIGRGRDTYKYKYSDLVNSLNSDLTTGADNQDLGYSSNGNAAGVVTITNGTNATIPIVTNDTAGLMTGRQKQDLDALASGGGGGANVTGTDPISVSGSNNISLKYNRGITVSGGNLEANIGSGLRFNGNTIIADKFDDSKEVFEPLVIVNAAGDSKDTTRNEYRRDNVWTGNFTIPDGCRELSVVWRVRMMIRPTSTSGINDNPNYSTIWVDDIQAELSLTGQGASESISRIIATPLSTAPVENRKQGTIGMRSNIWRLSNSSGRRTINYSGRSGWYDAQGGGNGECIWNGLQMFIFPSS